MDKMKNRIKGSGVLVVILSAIAFTVYIMSTYSEQEHFSILQNKYEKDIVSTYGKDVENIDEFYNDILIKNSQNENNI